MLKQFIAGLCLVWMPVPGAIAADRDTTVTPAGEAEATHREFVAYGEWVLQIDRILNPALLEVRALSPQWEAALKLRTGVEAQRKFLPALAQAKLTVAESRRKLAAMPVPAFDLLKLDGDASAAAVHAEMTRMLGQIDALLDTFPPVLKALASNDPKAADAALAQMLGSAKTMFRAQEAMAGAWIATLEPDDPGRDVLAFERLFYRSATRLMTTAELVARRRQDPALGPDLARIADEMDQVIARGMGAIDAGQAKAMALILETGSDAEGRSSKAMLTKSHAIQGMYRDSFAIGRGYVAALRATAKRVTGVPVALSQLQPLMQTLRTTRAELDAVGTRQAEVMAGTR